jgi:hypothetical protein
MGMLLVLALVVALAGCGGSSESPSTAEPDAPGARAAGEGERGSVQALPADRHKEVTALEAGKERAGQAGERASEHKPTKGPADACGTLSGPDANACGLSYTICKLDAKGIVTAYYEETPGTPDLDQYATRYAADEYGTSGSSESAAYMGCLGALSDEYDALYG